VFKHPDMTQLPRNIEKFRAWINAYRSRNLEIDAY